MATSGHLLKCTCLPLAFVQCTPKIGDFVITTATSYYIVTDVIESYNLPWQCYRKVFPSHAQSSPPGVYNMLLILPLCDKSLASVNGCLQVTMGKYFS